MRSRSPLYRLWRPLAGMAVVVIYGTVGYIVIEGWNVLDAFFMTLITITTVGYNEIHPLSPAGRLFTSTLILGGVATILWAFGVFAEVASTGELGKFRRSRSMEARRRRLKDHFILCGYGRMGTQVVKELDREGAAYIVIDNNPDALARLQAEGRLFIEGDGSAEDLLREAGIERARGLISTVDSDERAVYIVLAARALNPDLYILSRAGQPASIRRLELAGASRVISPYLMAGHQMAAMALRPALVDLLETIQDRDFGVEELVVPPRASVTGRSLEAAGLLSDGCAQVMAVRRTDGTTIVRPAADLLLQEGDLLVALGSQTELDRTATMMK